MVSGIHAMGTPATERHSDDPKVAAALLVMVTDERDILTTGMHTGAPWTSALWPVHTVFGIDNAARASTLLPKPPSLEATYRTDRRCCDMSGAYWSERRDLNSGPPVPQTGAYHLMMQVRRAPAP